MDRSFVRHSTVVGRKYSEGSVAFAATPTLTSADLALSQLVTNTGGKFTFNKTIV